MNLPFAVEVFLFFPPVMNAALAVYVWQQRPIRGATASALILLAAAWWAGCYAFQISAGPDLAAQVLWAKLRHFGLLAAPSLVAIFILQYTDHQSWLNWRTWLALWAPPAVVLLAVLTNDLHGLYWPSTSLTQVDGLYIMVPQRGALNWLNSAYSYVVLGLATVYLLRWVYTNYHRIYRRQAFVFVVSILVPWLSNAIYLSGLSVLDPAPFAFTLTGVGLAWAILGYRLLDLAPIARDRVIEELDEGMIVLDVVGRVVDINRAGLRLLGDPPQGSVLGQPSVKVFARWPDLIQRFRDVRNIQTEVTVGDGPAAHSYLVHIASLTGDQGRVITFRDVSDRQRAAQSLQRRNAHLAALYEIVLDLLNHRDVDSLLQTIVTEAARLLDAPYVELNLIEGDHLAVRAFTINQPFLQGERVSRAEAQLSWQAFDTHQPVLVNDYATWSGRRTVYDGVKLGSVAAIPILAGDRCLGVLDLARLTPNTPFDEEQVWMANLFARIAALVLENANVFADSQRELASRIRIEKELATQRDFAMQVMNTMGQGLAVTGPDGRYEYVNPVAAGLVGITPQEAIGRRPAEFVVPEDAPLLNQAVELRANGQTATHEIRLRREDNGGENYVLFTNVPRLAADGQVVGSIAVVTDLTERRRAEQALAAERTRLRSLIDASRDGIILVGANLTLQVVNIPAMHLLHLPGEIQDWIGKSLTDLILQLRHRTPALSQVLVHEARRAAQGDLAPGHGQSELGVSVFEWLNLPVQSGPDILGRLVVVRDVTEQRRLDQLRDDLTHTLIHDLRSPLTGVLAALDLLEMETAQQDPAEQAQLLSVARQSADAMLQLVNTLLDISRLENRKVPLECELVGIKLLVSKVLDMQQPLATARQLQVHNLVPATLPLAWADPALIERVLQNLVSNAIKFTPVQGQIEIAAQVSGPEAQNLLVSVRNSGPGVPAELDGHLFEKFVSGPQRGRGSGLGLALCRLAVEAHGGQIWTTRTDQNLTEFNFWLPIQQAEINKRKTLID